MTRQRRLGLQGAAAAVVLGAARAAGAQPAAWGTAAVAGASAAGPGAPRPVTVAAAADLKFALDETLAAFAATRPGVQVRAVYGSSGNLSTQILQGAPFDLFLSADEALVFALADAGRTVDRGRVYAVGHLVLLVPHGSPLQADGGLADLRAALADGRLQRLAIANPAHAPYGQRAREALQHARLWDAIQPRLVLGDNVAQAAQFAMSGSAQGGIVAKSLALAPPLRPRSRFAPIDPAWHQPLRQRMVRLRGAVAGTQAVESFVASDAAKQVFKRYGFESA
jgi:molybdate transport system substrate-binding protein